MFRWAPIYINDKFLKSCLYLNYQSFIKSAISTNSSFIESRGCLSFMNSVGVGSADTFVAGIFTRMTGAQKAIVAKCKHQNLHLKGSLF